MKETRSYAEWLPVLKNSDVIYLFLYKKNGTAVNRCAFDNLEKAVRTVSDVKVFFANVEETRDIHPNYPVNTVPILLEFEKGVLKNTLKGCQDSTYYINHFENKMASITAQKEGKPSYSVTVYSTPTCSWCTTLKTYLRKNRIQFTDIDVSRDQDAAREMVNRSGQQGVPQSVINGEVIVGFNKARIDQLLGTK
ncbi:MAG: hypothetical protein JXA23_03800 [Bacteroidales bacterium]|nr:hypothetical protein [Bacteroidales bacterium]